MTTLSFDPDHVDDRLVVSCTSPEGGAAILRLGDRVRLDDGRGNVVNALVLRQRGHQVVVRISEPGPAAIRALRDVLRGVDPPRRRRRRWLPVRVLGRASQRR